MVDKQKFIKRASRGKRRLSFHSPFAQTLPRLFSIFVTILHPNIPPSQTPVMDAGSGSGDETVGKRTQRPLYSVGVPSTPSATHGGLKLPIARSNTEEAIALLRFNIENNICPRRSKRSLDFILSHRQPPYVSHLRLTAVYSCRSYSSVNSDPRRKIGLPKDSNLLLAQESTR